MCWEFSIAVQFIVRIRLCYFNKKETNHEFGVTGRIQKSATKVWSLRGGFNAVFTLLRREQCLCYDRSGFWLEILNLVGRFEFYGRGRRKEFPVWPCLKV